MKNSLTILISLFIYYPIQAQSIAGIEQSYYSSGRLSTALVPKFYYQSASGWYGALHYNYEDAHTLSAWAGKTFDKHGISLTPLAGVMTGQSRGALVGLDINASVHKLRLSSTIENSFSARAGSPSFFYSWSDAGWQMTSAAYAGIALQTTLTSGQRTQLQPGCEVGLDTNGWNFSFYIFCPRGNDNYFVLGLAREWKISPRTAHHQKRTDHP